MQDWKSDLEKALLGVRAASEEQWARAPAFIFDPQASVGGYCWEPGTRWRAGLTDGEIDALSRRHEFTVPADYRIYLRTLNGMVPRRQGAVFAPGGLRPSTAPGFYSWEADAPEIRDALRAVLEGLLFDVVHNALWRTEWGPREPGSEERVLREQLRAAPPLLPIFGHRHMLVLDPDRPNPIVSIYQSDMIVYGDNILSYLLHELGVTAPPVPASVARQSRSDLGDVPFWGAFLR